MKTTKQLLIMLVLVIFSTAASAQSYNYDTKNAKRIVVEGLLGELTFEGHNGTDILIEAQNYKGVPERADGLKAIYNGATENTGVGLNINTVEDVIYIYGANKQSEEASYTIKVPYSLSLKVNYSNPFIDFDDITFKNIKSEITVKTLDANIHLIDITGPVTSSTIDGNTTAIFTKVNQENPIMLSCIDGEVDITLPADTPADLKFSTVDGEVYTDFDINFTKVAKRNSSTLNYFGGHNNSKGTINGGGVEITLKSIDGTIYLRKK